LVQPLFKSGLLPFNPNSGVTSPKRFWGANIFDFTRATVFLFGMPLLLKAQND